MPRCHREFIASYGVFGSNSEFQPKVDAGMGDSAKRGQYGSTARALHWLTVLLVVFAWTTARFGSQLFDEGVDALHAATAIGLGIHIWVGLAIFIIATFRFRWRIANLPPPSEANEFNHWLIASTDFSARVTHYVLYILLLVVPVTGILLLFAERKTLSAFGSVEMAPWSGVTLGSLRVLWHLHVMLANALVIVAVFHAVTAVLHHVVFRDNTLQRMLPARRKDDPDANP